ncbi:MAG: hypothetical protein HY744_16830 [Deltaproteobacteria bacterium]|nr:hypothetical protein [Deltaproteobacteria bacterium]
MKAPIILQRSLVLQGWRVAGTVAFSTRREWEPAVLKLAVQHGALTPEMVASDLLGGRLGMARRLVDVCIRLELLERTSPACLPTAAGRQTAETGMVLVPERGTWTVWGCEDPLLSSPIVAVEPWREPSAKDERGKDTRRVFAKLPQWLTATLARECEPLGGDHRALRIDDLGKEQKGEAVDGARTLRLTLAIELADARVRITGDLGGEPIDADVAAPKLSHDAAWTTLLQQAGLASGWDAHRRALWVAFKETSEPERSTLKRAVRLARPELSGVGCFDDTTIEEVPLRPRSKSDAAEWAEWRLVHEIGGYAIGDALEVAYRKAVASFEDMAPPCPSRAALAERLRGTDRPPPTYWRLQAPADWALDGRDGR